MLYTGKSADGSDIQEVSLQLYTNPYNEDEWSTEPYPILSGKEKRRLRRKNERNRKQKKS